MKKGSTKSLLQVTMVCMLASLHPLSSIAHAAYVRPAKTASPRIAEKSVTGKVLSKDDNTPVPGVTVVVKGTTAGTTTDVDGKYQINVADNQSVLVFSAVGFLTQEKEVGNASVVDITLATDQKHWMK